MLRMEICPVDRSWLHTYILEPCLQGCDLFNLAWDEEDRSLERKPLSLKERVIYFLQGIPLMCPLINTIVWLAWQTFGKPEKWTDPFCPESSYHPPQTAPPILVQRPAEGEPQAEIEQFGFIEKGDNTEYQTNWVVEKFPALIVANQTASEFSSRGIYQTDYSLKELNYQHGEKKIGLALTDPTKIYVEISKDSKITTQKTLERPQDGLPWIQQRAIGFKLFVLNQQEEMEFYSVIPEYPWYVQWIPFLEAAPFLMKLKATKIGEEDVPGFGRLLKVVVKSTRDFPYNRDQSELWFDRATGSLKRFVDSGTFISAKVGELFQNGP